MLPFTRHSLWLIVPIKPFAQSKSRLASTLTVEGRTLLIRTLFRHVLVTARASQLFSGILVVSRDADALAIASEEGAIPLLETGNDLNAALEEARASTWISDATALLVLPADLPNITIAELQRLASSENLPAHPRAPMVTLVPSNTGGTNALLQQPPHAIPFAFGEDSFARHSRLARQRALPVHVLESPALAFDVDLPDDLALLATN